MQITGLWTALITPFDQNLEVDYQGLKKLIDLQLDANVDGVVALGTTAETPTLTKEEKDKIVLTIKAQLAGRKPLMVGTGSYSTKETIDNTKKAADLGADIALVVNPYYNKPTQTGLIKHFEAVAENSPIPIYLYNIQGRTGVNLSTAALKVIAQNPKILGVKEASGNIEQITEVIDEVQNKLPNFTVLSGDDGLTFPLMCLGGRGIISVASNLIPKEVGQLVKLAATGKFEESKKEHYRLRKFFQALFIETNPAPLKFAMNSKDFPAGGLRLPMCEISEASKKVVIDRFTEIF